METEHRTNSTQTKEILAAKRCVSLYAACYEKLGYTVDSVRKSGQNYVITLCRENAQSAAERRLEQSAQHKLRFVEVTEQKRARFSMLLLNLIIHVLLFCVQGVILYALQLDKAHPRTMLQVGVVLLECFLIAGLIMKVKELRGWKKVICDVTGHLYDVPALEFPAEQAPYVLSVLLTRGHNLISNVIYWCTGRQYTHAALGLGTQTDVFYSFAFRGFRIEHPGHRKLRGRRKESLCYQFRITQEEYQQAAHRMEQFQKGAGATRYDLLGAVLSVLHIYRPAKTRGAYFCSEFVSEQLQRLPSFHLNLKANMYLPTYLAKVLILQDNLLDVKVNEV